MKTRLFKILMLLLTAILLNTCSNKYQFKFQNPKLSLDVRVNDLISRMTLEEKISQMIDVAPAIPRLGVPAYNWWSEGLHGVAAAGVATVFPQAIGLGSSFDTSLISEVSDVISTEFRAKHHEFIRNNDFGRFKGLTVWSPNINIFRDPRWGRGQETYGEDPFLTSRIGVAFVKGLQGNDPKYLKTISTPKHYAVHSGPEPERHRFNAITDKRDFLETYSFAFEALIREGGAWSIMGAYNRYMNDPCCASPFLLKETLRDKWGFKGYVVSDCGAIDDIWRNHKVVNSAAEAAALAVKAGCDLNCGDTYMNLKEAVQKGLITEKDLDVSLKRLFEARFRLGMFDPPEMVSYARIPYSENDSQEHRKLALKAAHETIVLLKNENHSLPLKKDIKHVAVIGPNANNANVLYGNYNGISSHPVTPLEGIKNKLGTNAEVLYAMGCSHTDDSPLLETIPKEFLSFEGKPGLKAEYFDNMEFKGNPVAVRQDSLLNFEWNGSSPLKGVAGEKFSVRWSGKITVPHTNDYIIAVTGDDGYRLFLDDKLVYELWRDQPPTTSRKSFRFKAGETHQVKIEYYQNSGGSSLAFQYVEKSTDYAKEAIEIARKSDVILFFGGISSSLEGEEMGVFIPGFNGGDRTNTDLPIIQTNLLKKLKETGKPVILVLMSGSALSVNWEATNLPAIVEAWYPGEEGGNAIADVIFGDYNPAARLPVTFYKSVDQLPPFEEYAMKGRTYKYFEGTPLFPFGFGLSYSSFAYSNVSLPAVVETGNGFKVSIDVQNTSQIDGDEVVEAYLSNKSAKVPVPIRSLAGFRRVNLKAGEKKTITFNISAKQLSVITDEGKRIIEAGTYEICLGGCQPVAFKPESTNSIKSNFEVKGESKAMDK